MKSDFRSLILPLILTLLMLCVLEIFSTAFLPVVGLRKYIIPFNILIILYLGFKLESPYIAILIILIEYFHSFFSIEGWEFGTIAGVFICILTSYLRDILHFSSAGMTMLVTQIFQGVWFLIVSAIMYIRLENMDYIVGKFWRFIPESLLISLLAPFFFSVLDRIWSGGEGGMLGDEV